MPQENPQLRVLIVDDDQVDRRAVRRALGDGYVLIEAEDGKQALGIINSERPDCILLDYNIPGTETLELLDDLRVHAPLVMLTGHGGEAVAVAAMKAGAMDYLSKNDFSAESLEAAIRTSVDKASRHRQRMESRERLQRDYRHEKEKRLELEAGLAVARDIQQSLLPSVPPPLEGFDIAGMCLPAEAAGGDFFDYLPMSDGTLGLVIGDLSGHGIGPALLAAETRAYMRALTRLSSDVGHVATTVNRLLWEDTAGRRFAALFLARIDPHARTLTYGAAGHATYVIHPSGDFTTLASTAPPLGVFDRSVVATSGPVPLKAGDILFMATDGVYESHSVDRRLFGKDRAIGLIHAYRSNPAEKIIDALLNALRTFVQNQPLADDVTIVLAKVTDERNVIIG